ncbi:MAG: orotate phosphoribosyltransferase [Deltaproteobacteria bacterium]|nr:orotate phosphoribosyltransferase [Deltaproteobacteria bacterium]
MREDLLKILYKNSFDYDPNSGFLLASGQKSDVYIDVKKTVLSAEAIVLTGRMFYKLIKDEDIDAIGGLTLGADPIAYAAALISNLDKNPLSVFIVRKEPKRHGTQRWIEGNLKEGARVVVADDVVTTGGSTIKAIERAREAGFVVKTVVCLVDRQEGGKENILKASGMELRSVFTKTDLLRLHGVKK